MSKVIDWDAYTYEPSVQLTLEAPRLSRDVHEYKILRDSIDRASVEGKVTWIRNTAGAVIAAIVPDGIAMQGMAADDENGGDPW